VHVALLITIVLSAVLRIVYPLLDPDYDWANGFKYVSLVPVATVLVGWSIYRWQGQVLVGGLGQPGHRWQLGETTRQVRGW
jgi:hypothetical protein